VPISKSEPSQHGVVAPPLPLRLGRYDVIDRLAFGGMAEILVCCERGLAGLERLVVVKRILPHLAAHTSFVDMFLDEARFVARITHPNVVQIFELAQDEHGAPFIAMEYVPGSSLRDVLVAAIENKQATPIEAALAMMAQACAGAHAAHELTDGSGRPLGLVHRDISPHNLMVTSEGHTKLLDFGIAKATESTDLTDQTRTGALKGKVLYMSPEQCRQLPLDRRSDVFSLGIVLWEALAQERLFKRSSELESMHAIVEGELPDLRKLRPDVPEAVVRVVERALHKDREQRHPTADAMRNALLEAARQAKLRATPDELGAFVRPLLGDAQKKRQSELLQQAHDRTQATPASALADPVLLGAMGEEATIVDKKKRPTSLTVDERRPSKASEPSVPTGGTTPAASAMALSARTTAVTVDGAAPEATPLVHRVRAPISMALLATLALALGVFAVWQLLGSGASSRRGAALSIGFPMTSDETVVRADIEPLRASLERALARPVNVVITTSYDDLKQWLLTGAIDVAALPPYLYVETRTNEPRVTLIATKLVEGSAGNDSVLYVNESSGVTTIAELKGKRLCFPDAKSATGYLFPRLALKRAGVDPDRDIVNHLSGSHLQSMREKVSGVCDAAATYPGGYLAADRAGVPVARARQLAIIGRSPHDAMVARVDMSEPEQAALKAALFAFRPEDAGRSGRVERISGFAPGNDRDYDGVRAALAASAH
jgi:serine/threonine-protein kinase